VNLRETLVSFVVAFAALERGPHQNTAIPINPPWIMLTRMKSRLWFVASGLMLLLGITFIAWHWHGTANVNLAIPLSSTSIQFCGSANGGLALAGLGALIFAALLFVIAIFRWIFGRSDKPKVNLAKPPEKVS